MSSIIANNPTLRDVTSSLDPDGSVAAVIELLHETQEILADMTFHEGNLPTGHKHVVRTGLPTPTWRKLYGGVVPDKSTRAQITDTCGMLEAYAEIDVALADLNGNGAEFMGDESAAHIESMGQSLAATTISGNISVNPERFEGIYSRYNSLSAANADNIIDAGGAGSDNASILLVVWSPRTVFGIIPKGSQAGIKVTPKGQVTADNVNGTEGKMEVYRTHFRLDAGLAVADWRYIVRICNIDRSLLTRDLSTGADLNDLMFQAVALIPSLSMGRAAFYASRDIITMWGRQTSDKLANSTLTREDVGGVKSPLFDGDIPIRRVDAMAADEARVV